MNKICIVSSYSSTCGIASYTKSLIQGFCDENINVDIIELNQSILHSDLNIDKKLSKIHIEQIKNDIKNYTNINIQMEFGLFGSNLYDINKRLFILLKACKNKKISITFHTIESNTFTDIIKNSLISLIKFKLSGVYASICGINSAFKAFILKRVTRFVLKNGGSIIVHTERDRRIIANMYGKDTNRIYSHPLCFHNDIENIDNNKILNIKNQFKINKNKKIIGVFGFVSEYKGLDTAIKSLQFLPSEYILCIFGGQHPSSVTQEPTGSPYMKRLLQLIEDKKLENRVIFLGIVDNELDFSLYMKMCDHIILPYNEIGQSGSGVASLALVLNENVYLSRTLAFKELANYFVNSFYFFDIGNYQEIAEKIKTSSNIKNTGRKDSLKKYNIKTNINVYKNSLGID